MSRTTRRAARFRGDRLTSAWMVLALVTSAVVLVHPGALPRPLWTSVHVLTLGVLTSSVLQWSWYFARALLHLPAADRRSGRDATLRLVAFHLVLVGLVGAMWAGSAPGTVAGATTIGAIVAWHGVALVRAARTRLGNRFAVVVRFYVVGAGFLVAGCTLAGLLTVALLDPDAPTWLVQARDRLTLAHALVNLGGWLGLSVLGTLVTLGPTVLRRRIDPDALDHAVAALPALAVAVAGAATAAVLGWLPGVGIGLIAFAGAAAVGVGRPLGRVARVAGPASYPAWTLGSGLTFAALGLGGVAVQAFVATDAAGLRERALPWLVVLGAGGVLQVLVGALTYLMPVVIGGGPGPVRLGMAVLETAWPLRVGLRSAALTLLGVAALTADPAAATSTPVRSWWALVLVGYLLDVALLARAGAAQVRARRANGGDPPTAVPVTLEPPARRLP